jgi:hypothetical protein
VVADDPRVGERRADRLAVAVIGRVCPVRCVWSG